MIQSSLVFSEKFC